MSAFEPSVSKLQASMAPVKAPPTAASLKRSSPSWEHQPSLVTKRQRREYHRYHRLQKPLETGGLEPVIADDTPVDKLLNVSIGLMLKEVGFDLADPVALDSLRSGVEECMHSVPSFRSVI